MTARSAEVTAYVTPSVKDRATNMYARWGISLSDAINAFLVKSIDVGGIPFDMRTGGAPVYDAATVLPPDPAWGSSILPASMDDDEDGLYDHLIR